jgi:glycosyltransferase involved in cell wall biosynthesis
MQKRVCHMTSVHSRDDIRIFKKQCCSLKSAGYNVNLIVADGGGDEIKNGIQIHDIGATIGGRLERFTKTAKRVYKKAKELDCDIYHFHDPELIRFGNKLLKSGKKVIYDVHEDVAKQTYSKDYIPKYIQPILASFIRLYENHYASKFSYISTATDHIYKQLAKVNKNSICISNFPLLTELEGSGDWSKKKNEIAYIGAITQNRGITELIESIGKTTVRLNLAGSFENIELEKQTKLLSNWNKVNYFGQVNRQDVKEILENSKIGVVTFHPLPNHIDAQPNKMFEYMSAGIPIIASDFPLWRSIIEGNNCGICVDPLNPKEITEAINYLIENSALAKSMGENGRKAVIEKFNWEREHQKLILIYRMLI